MIESSCVVRPIADRDLDEQAYFADEIVCQVGYVEMRLIFWFLFWLGSAFLIFAILLGQIPGEPTVFDKEVLSITSLLLAISLVVGRFRWRAYKWRAGAIPTAILSLELMLCIFGLVAALTYRRH